MAFLILRALPTLSQLVD